jgi:thioredoxin 1
MENFTTVINGDDPVLVDFVNNKAFGSHAYALKEVANALGERLRIIKVDTAKNKTILSAYGLHLQNSFSPTLILFRKGKMLWRDNQELSKTDIMMNIVYNLR